MEKNMKKNIHIYVYIYIYMYITYHITVQQKLTHCKSTLLELKKKISHSLTQASPFRLWVSFSIILKWRFLYKYRTVAYKLHSAWPTTDSQLLWLFASSITYTTYHNMLKLCFCTFSSFILVWVLTSQGLWPIHSVLAYSGQSIYLLNIN